MLTEPVRDSPKTETSGRPSQISMAFLPIQSESKR